MRHCLAVGANRFDIHGVSAVSYTHLDVYKRQVQAKSGSGWTTKASGSGGREASASCTAQKGTEYRAYAVATIYDSEGNKVDTVKSYSSSSVY